MKRLAAVLLFIPFVAHAEVISTRAGLFTCPDAGSGSVTTDAAGNPSVRIDGRDVACSPGAPLQPTLAATPLNRGAPQQTRMPTLPPDTQAALDATSDAAHRELYWRSEVIRLQTMVGQAKPRDESALAAITDLRRQLDAASAAAADAKQALNACTPNAEVDALRKQLAAALRADAAKPAP